MCNLYLAGKVEESRKLYYKVLPLCHCLFWETNPAPVKTALHLMGKIESDFVRLPLVPTSEGTRERLRKELSAYGLI